MFNIHYPYLVKTSFTYGKVHLAIQNSLKKGKNLDTFVEVFNI